MIKQALVAALFLLAALGARAGVVDIDSAEVAKLAAAGVPVIDIRTEAEWRESGVIAGARLMTYFDENGRADPPVWLEKLKAATGAGKPVILICRSGNRTKAASRFLAEQAGYATVYNARDGMRSWLKEGRPVVPPGSALATCPAGRAC